MFGYIAITLSLSSARTTGWRNQATMETHSRAIRWTFSQNLTCCGLHFICQWLLIPPLKITVLLLLLGPGVIRRTQRRRQSCGCFRRTTCHSSHSHRQCVCWCLASQWSTLSYAHIYMSHPPLSSRNEMPRALSRRWKNTSPKSPKSYDRTNLDRFNASKRENLSRATWSKWPWVTKCPPIFVSRRSTRPLCVSTSRCWLARVCR